MLASSFLKMLSSSMLSRGSTHLVAIADLDSIICVCCIVRARRDIVIIQFITDSWSDDDWLDKEERSSSFDWRLYDALSLHVCVFFAADLRNELCAREMRAKMLLCMHGSSRRCAIGSSSPLMDVLPT